MPLPSAISAGWTRVRNWPFVSVFAIAFALQLIGEQFPFSPFPMYSGFSKETTVLYVTDGADQPLAIKNYFRLSASKVKKAYNTELKIVCASHGYEDGMATVADLRAAGQATLDFLKTQTRPGGLARIEKHGLKLYRISLLMDKKGFQRESALVGELPR